MTDIANRYFVSPKTVDRILRSYTYVVNPYTYQLPECLLIDELKGTNDCHSKFCFIFSDGETGKIIDILNDRRNFAIKDHFLYFSLESILTEITEQRCLISAGFWAVWYGS